MSLVKGYTNDQSLEKIYCSHETRPVSRETMVLRPPVLSVGIGCNRGTGVEDIYDFLALVFSEGNLSMHSINRIASIDLKKNEPGLLSLAEKMGLPLDFYTREALNSVTAIETPSPMVEKHVGVKSVSEASAILSAGHGRLIITKKKNKDVTIAVAIEK
jgi:cobalt-precorrin 5A hydrolase